MFQMEILTDGFLPKEDFHYEKKYDANSDDYRSVLFDICNLFHESNHIKFHVAGFGEDGWPVDCRYDLLTIVEQLPEIVKKISDNSFAFVLDFYEQGIERELIFKESQNDVQVTCNSRTDWTPNPPQISMGKDEIAGIFLKLYNDFICISGNLCKNLLQHPLMAGFIKKIDGAG